MINPNSSISSPIIKHGFTIDVEDWYHGISDSIFYESREHRLHHGLDKLLELLEVNQVKATFFWLGLAAIENQKLIKHVAELGHEIGCHGWTHEPIYKMSPTRFLEETKRAAGVIGDFTGQQVVAYRAPYFSINQNSLWALNILAKLGFLYDASISLFHNARSGIKNFSPRIQKFETSYGSIYELPLSVRRVFGQIIPTSGGTYFRLYPYFFTQSNFYILEKNQQSVIFYIHPWELDINRPLGPMGWKERLSNKVNIHSTERKLRKLMQDFSFTSLRELLDEHISANQ